MSREATVRFPYPSFRRGQDKVAEEVAKTVERGEALLLRAPTGFGKTVAVIYGVLLSGAERTLYLVRTRNEIEPVLRELSKFGVEYVFLYSARRMCPLLAGSGEAPPPDEFWENCRLARLKGVCPYYEALTQLEKLEDIVFNVVSRFSPSPYRVVKELSSLGLCPFFALREAALHARFVVATYPYALKHDIFSSVFEPLEYRDFVMVFDEAHSLMDAASVLETRVRLPDIEGFEAELERYAGGSEWGARVAKRLKRLLQSLKPPPEGRLKRIDKHKVLSILEDPGALADLATEIRLNKFREALSTDAKSFARIRVYAARIAEFAAIASMEGVEVFAARGKTGVELVAVPVDQCIATREPLNSSKAVVLMSGTLPPEQYIRDVLCLERPARLLDVELLYGSPFAKSYYTILTLNLTSKYTERGGEMYSMYAEHVRAALEECGGIVLAVYPSYEFMSEVLKRLPKDTPMVVETRESKIDEVRGEALRLLEERGRVLLNAVAGGKLVEGVEFTVEGRSLVHAVFLAGVPYPQPDDYTRSLLEHLEERLGGEKARYYLYTVSAYIRARQALGRALRSENDRAIFVLGDRRYASRQLRELMRVKVHAYTSTLEEFRERIREAKRRLGL